MIWDIFKWFELTKTPKETTLCLVQRYDLSKSYFYERTASSRAVHRMMSDYSQWKVEFSFSFEVIALNFEQLPIKTFDCECLLHLLSHSRWSKALQTAVLLNGIWRATARFAFPFKQACASSANSPSSEWHPTNACLPLVCLWCWVCQPN